MTTTTRSAIFSFAAAAGFLLSSPVAGQERAEKNDTTGIAALRRDFSLTQPGRDLLDLLDRKGVAVVYDSTIADAGECRDAENKIALNPRMPAGEQPVVLAHEAWHMHQRHDLGAGRWEESAITPGQFFTLRHYQEADAFAFSAWFWAGRLQETGQDPEGMPPQKLSSTFAIAKGLLREMQGDGLSAGEYREIAFERAFYDLGDFEYNERHFLLAGSRVPILEQLAGEALESPDSDFGRQMLELTHQYMSTAPDSAHFEALLTHFGSRSLDLRDATSLQDGDVPVRNLYAYPLLALGADPHKSEIAENLKTLDERFLATKRNVLSLAAQQKGP